MDLKLLRERTRPEHEATEAVVPLMQPGLTRSRYAEVLQGFCDVVTAWDAVAQADAPAELAPLVAERLRAPSAAADVAYFGTPQPYGTQTHAAQTQDSQAHAAQTQGPQAQEPGAMTLHALAGRMRTLFQQADGTTRAAAFLGAMYVMEGSTLGGQYIASHVEQELHLQPGEGTRYFRGYGKETVPMWRAFQQVLAAVPDEQGDIVIGSAKGMFGIFQQRMSQLSPLEKDILQGTQPARED